MTKFRARNGLAWWAVVAVLGLSVTGIGQTIPEEAGFRDFGKTYKEKRQERIDNMVDNSCKVLYQGGHGSGILFVRGEEVYVLTAAHVIRDPVTVQLFGWQVLPQQLMPRKRTYGKNSAIWIHRHRQSETIFVDDVYEAELVAVDGPTDAAILKIKDATPENFPGLEGAIFDLTNNKSLKSGMKTIHVGNFNQSKNAVTDGVICNPQHALTGGSPPLPPFRVIQVTNISGPGSSGGGVYLESNGKAIGILVRVAWLPGDALVIPAYEIDQWLNDQSEELGKLLEEPE